MGRGRAGDWIPARDAWMRWRLIGAFMLMTLLVVLVQDIPLANHLVRVERDRLTTSLERDAFLLGGRSADALKAGGPFPGEVAADVRRYGQASGARVVVVDATGTAVATSDDDQSATGSAYGSRPEIAAALTGQINAGQRYSQSLGQELLYVSVPVLSGESISGAVRLSYPASVVSDQVDGQLRTIWSVAATTVLLAGILAYLMARAVTRRLQQLRTATELLADGNLDTRTEEGAGAPELRTLAAAFNRMADRMKHLLEQQRALPPTPRTSSARPSPGFGSGLRTPLTPSPAIPARPAPWWRLPLKRPTGCSGSLTDCCCSAGPRGSHWHPFESISPTSSGPARSNGMTLPRSPGSASVWRPADGEHPGPARGCGADCRQPDRQRPRRRPGGIATAVGCFPGGSARHHRTACAGRGAGTFPRGLPACLQPLLARRGRQRRHRPGPVSGQAVGPGQRSHGRTCAQSP